MVIVMMGVSGAGKTRVGMELASSLGWRFFEGDDFHSPENVRKMSSATPLTDEDREPWLESLRRLLADLTGSEQQDARFLEAAVDVERELHGDIRHTDLAFGDRGMAADVLRRVKSFLKNAIEYRPRGALRLRGGVGVFYLSEDLRLAQHL